MGCLSMIKRTGLHIKTITHRSPLVWGRFGVLLFGVHCRVATDPWISLALQTWTHPLWSIDRLYEDLDLTADLCGGPQLASTVMSSNE